MASGADIQVEQGNYTRIHNDILDALVRTKLNGQEWTALVFLLRKTYGFRKKEDRISYSQFAEGLGVQRKHAARVLKKLQQRRIVIVSDNGNNQAKTWRFNKYIEQWDTKTDPNTEDTTVPKVGDSSRPTVPKVGDKTVPKVGDHKRKKEKRDHLTTPAPAPVLSDGDDCDGKLLLQQLRDQGFVYLDTEARRIAAGIEEDHSPAAIDAAITQLVKAHQKQTKVGKRGITAPLAYLSAILRNDADNRNGHKHEPVSVLEFCIEDLT